MEIDKQTDSAILGIRSQMIELQESSKSIMKKQQTDMQEYEEKLRVRELEISRLEGLLNKENTTYSQQTSPQKKN